MSLPPPEEVHPFARDSIRRTVGDLNEWAGVPELFPAMYWQAAQNIRAILAQEEEFKINPPFGDVLTWDESSRRWCRNPYLVGGTNRRTRSAPDNPYSRPRSIAEVAAELEPGSLYSRPIDE